MSKIRHSISIRLARYGVIIAFIFGIIISCVQIYVDYKKQTVELERNLAQTINFIKQSLGKAIFEVDDAFIIDIVNGLLDYQPIIKISVFDDAKVLLATVDKANEEKRDKFKNALSKRVELTYPIEITESEMGIIKVTADTYYVLGAFIDRAWLILVSGIIRNTLLASILLLLCYYIISRPVINITRKLSYIDAQQPETVRIDLPSTHTHDELGQLIRSVNELLDTIMEINKSLEDKIDQRTNQLKVKAAEAVDALDKLQIAQNQLVTSEKNAALGELVAGVSHEINTPLGISVTAASHLEDETKLLAEKQANKTMKKVDLLNFVELSISSTHILLSNLNRAATLIKSFKQIAVDQTGEEKRDFHIVPYLNDTLFSLKPKFKNKNIIVEITGDDNIILDSYPGVYSQIFSNLLMNSLIHAFEEDAEGKINVNIQMDNNHLIIKYQDNGKGMDEESTHKVFNPFYTTKRGSGGTGLGMNIVFNIITVKLGGEVECTSELGKGVTFTIKIPLSFENNKVYKNKV